MATWPTIIDDDGSGTTGTVLNDALFDQMRDYVDETGGFTYVTNNHTGTQHNWAIPGRTRNTYVSWQGVAALAITGIANPTLGDRLTIKNDGTADISFFHNNVGTPVGYRFFLVAQSAPTVIGFQGWASFLWDATSWKLTGHDHGTPTVPTFAASNFQGVSPMTLTVAAGGVNTSTWVLRGRQVTIALYFTGTTSGSASTDIALLSPLWGGFTLANSIALGCPVGDPVQPALSNLGVILAGTGIGIPAGQLWVRKNAGAAWGIGAITAGLQLTFSVT